MPDFIEQLLEDSPGVFAAYQDSGNVARSILALVDARDRAGLTSTQVAEWIANHMGWSFKKAQSWVIRFEIGELGGNTPIWLLQAYVRAVGARATITIDASFRTPRSQ